MGTNNVGAGKITRLKYIIVKIANNRLQDEKRNIALKSVEIVIGLVRHTSASSVAVSVQMLRARTQGHIAFRANRCKVRKLTRIAWLRKGAIVSAKPKKKGVYLMQIHAFAGP